MTPAIVAHGPAALPARRAVSGPRDRLVRLTIRLRLTRPICQEPGAGSRPAVSGMPGHAPVGQTGSRLTAKLAKSAKSGLLHLPPQTPMPSAFPIPPTLRDARQLLLVVAGGWSSRDARLQRRAAGRCGAVEGDRAAGGGQPRALGVGAGIRQQRHAPRTCRRSARAMGGRRPASLRSPRCSAMPLRTVLSRAARLPWLHGTRDLKCVDDRASRITTRSSIRRGVHRVDWTSCEDMLRPDRRYAVGAVVGHNCVPAVPAGSCGFSWMSGGGPGVPTARYGDVAGRHDGDCWLAGWGRVAGAGAVAAGGVRGFARDVGAAAVCGA